MQKNISKAVINRLPKYYRYLEDLKSEGVERISSGELSSKMKVTASQIRQDLNNFGGFGQQGYGYNVNYLLNEIGQILGIDKTKKLVVIGGGNMGKALTNYKSFRSYGFDIVGVFDVNPELVGKKINDLTIQNYDEIDDFLLNHKIDIAVLTVPKDYVEDIAKNLVRLGIKGFWNFAYTDLHLGEDIIVENVHLSDSLLCLSFNMKTVGAEND